MKMPYNINIYVCKIPFAKVFILMSICILLSSGCEMSNTKKIAFIKQNKQKTDDKIMAKQKNQLIVPDFLKNGEINIEEEMN